MLQVAPSKTDAERLLLVSPELAEVLTAIIFRVRRGKAALPLVSAYDVFEQTWSAPVPFLFQRRYGSEERPVTRSYIRECMAATSQAAQITIAGEPLEWRPHDFRRIFVTDALRSGLPPHIAAKICGHYVGDLCQVDHGWLRYRRAAVAGGEVEQLADFGPGVALVAGLADGGGDHLLGPGDEAGQGVQSDCAVAEPVRRAERGGGCRRLGRGRWRCRHRCGARAVRRAG